MIFSRRTSGGTYNRQRVVIFSHRTGGCAHNRQRVVIFSRRTSGAHITVGGVIFGNQAGGGVFAENAEVLRIWLYGRGIA